jgi:hypothetical protein
MKDPITGKPSNVVKRSDGASIPMEPLNIDYQQYLKWLEEGNTPEPAENT